MIEEIHRFLSALDDALLADADGQRLDLYVIGRSALILHHDLQLAPGGTKDIDVVQFGHPATPLGQKAIEQFGQGTEAARQYGLYLEFVLEALPPLPGGFRGRCEEVSGPWKVIRL